MSLIRPLYIYYIPLQPFLLSHPAPLHLLHPSTNLPHHSSGPSTFTTSLYNPSSSLIRPLDIYYIPLQQYNPSSSLIRPLYIYYIPLQPFLITHPAPLHLLHPSTTLPHHSSGPSTFTTSLYKPSSKIR